MVAIAIIDDQPAMIEGLTEFIHRDLHARVVAVGSEARDIGSIANCHAIDAMIVELCVPGDVIAEIANATKAMPRLKIIVFSRWTDPDLAARALDGGASAYVLKSSNAKEMVGAITATLQGQVFVTPSFASGVISAIRVKTELEKDRKSVKLSVRERQIISLLKTGKQNKEIAEYLSLSERTVKGYMTHLMFKMNVNSRLEVLIASEKMESYAVWRREVLSLIEYSS